MGIKKEMEETNVVSGTVLRLWSSPTPQGETRAATGWELDINIPNFQERFESGIFC